MLFYEHQPKTLLLQLHPALQEFICEDFHFAYTIVENEDGEELVLIEDACHSFLYH